MAVHATGTRRHRGIGLAVLVLTVACGPAAPTTAPSSSPILADQPAFTLDLETGDQTTRVFVFDPEDLVVEARPADPPEAAAALNSLTTSDIVAVRGRSDDWVVVGWLVTPCDRQAALTIATRVITVQLPPRPGCDALAIGRVVALRMAEPARATLFEPRLIDAPILPDVEPPTPVAPPPTAEGSSAACRLLVSRRVRPQCRRGNGTICRLM